MKIYLASSWKNQELVLMIADLLEREGFEVDAFCRATEDRVSFHLDEETDLAGCDGINCLSDLRVQEAFEEDKKWLDWAECVIMIKPCGNSSHLEGGYAKGQGKLLYILGEFPKGEFDVMYSFADKLFRFTEMSLLIEELKSK